MDSAKNIFLRKIGITINNRFKSGDISKLNKLYVDNGAARFEAALDDTYREICYGSDGNLNDRAVQLKFLKEFEKNIKYYSSKKARNALMASVYQVAITFLSCDDSEINLLLQKVLISLKKRHCNEKTIEEEFQLISDIAKVVSSYEEWVDYVKPLAA